MNSPAIPMKAVFVKIVPEISSSAPNRAGIKIFESNQIDTFWDGSEDGKDVLEVYYYTIDIMCIQGSNVLDN